MSLLLFVAGTAHFVMPEAFMRAMPDYLPFHFEIIILTGIVEWVFVALLWIPKPRLRLWTARVLAFYFLCLLPAHIHTSSNAIEMFGVSSPLLLWGRALLQFPLMYWAWSLGREARD